MELYFGIKWNEEHAKELMIRTLFTIINDDDCFPAQTKGIRSWSIS